MGSDEVKMPNSAEPNPEAAEQMMASWLIYLQRFNPSVSFIVLRSQQKGFWQCFFHSQLVRHACENSCGNSRGWNWLLGKQCDDSHNKATIDRARQGNSRGV